MPSPRHESKQIPATAWCSVESGNIHQVAQQEHCGEAIVLGRRTESRRLAQVRAEGNNSDEQRGDVLDIEEILYLAYQGERERTEEQYCTTSTPPITSTTTVLLIIRVYCDRPFVLG